MPVITGISQLASCPASGAQDDIGLIDDAALVYNGERIDWVGRRSDLPVQYADQAAIDAGQRLVIPGLIDCHTHLCFGGWRGDEFAQRIQGLTYQQIAAAGGGIRSTVAATREASAEQLFAKAACALAGMARLGVTTVECKSGYGLNPETELKQLQVYQHLRAQQPLELVSTFLGAHIVPPEFAERRDAYVDLLCDQMIPAVAEKQLAEFCDVYIDEGAFTLAEGQRILQTATKHKLKLKCHAEQLSHTGAAAMAAAMGATSIEHLEYLNEDDLSTIAKAGTVAVSLPLASLYLRERYTDCRRLIEAGIPVAVATDFNPGSAPSWHLPMALTLACLNQQMTPAEVVKGATTHAARAIAREHTLGSLLPGYQADLVIIDAPDVNQWLYHFQPNCAMAVMKKGKWLVEPFTGT
ncbi:MAG: imidazolonepropionase [Wenzhouxiangellaceae bacterium]